MSRKKDYTKYSRETAETGAVEIVEKMVEEIENEPEIDLEEKVMPEMIEEPEEEPVIGIVTDCARLNLRANPSSTSLVLGIVDGGSELVIIEDEITKDFYKVCTSVGLEGFCMKRYVTILP